MQTKTRSHKKVLLNHGFDETLAERLRPLFRGPYLVKEKRMFGGLAFMVNGHMCCGIVGKELVVRTGLDAFDQALSTASHAPDGASLPLKTKLHRNLRVISNQ